MTRRRSTVSSLGHAVLGLLARRPSTGYDLARQMRRPIGYFWEAAHSQIYPELAHLEASGLISHTEAAGRGPRRTKRYSLTAAGSRAQRDWLEAPMRPEPIRDVETMQVWSLWLAGPEVADRWLAARRAEHQSVLSTYERERRQLLTQGATPGEQLWCNLAAVELGVRSRTAELEWCTWMEVQVKLWRASGAE